MTGGDKKDEKEIPMVRFATAHGSLWIRPQVIAFIVDTTDGCTIQTTLNVGLKVKNKADESYRAAFTDDPPPSVP